MGIEILPVEGGWVEECRRCKRLREEAAEGVRNLAE